MVFGKAYHRLKTQYDYNLNRIYELVINSDPCYAFLLEGNTPVQNMLVMAHVVAHCDFFKNNVYFGGTHRHMVESMAAAASRFSSYEFKYGREKVEAFVDAALAIQEHIEPRRLTRENKRAKGDEDLCCRKKKTPYDDLWELDGSDNCSCLRCRPKECSRRQPPAPEKDVLLFILQNSADLEDWQRDILTVIRQETLYFWPQMETKIMNEGWATYWHTRIMREIDLSPADAVEFARMHAGIVERFRIHVNPYALGLKIYESIEKKEGRQKIFEVRSCENDVSFIRNYLTREIVEELDLYLYKKAGADWKVVEKDWKKVRDGMVANLTNCGHPYIVVLDGDFNKRGELYLKHIYEGVELDIRYTEKTLPYVYTLWGRPVHLETYLNNNPVLFSCNGERVSRKFL